MRTTTTTTPPDEPGEDAEPIKRVGRYVIFREIAAGGMATVHLARLAGPVGFSRVVAVKRLHPHLVRDPEFNAMFIDEAKLAARVRHPNVLPIIDVVADGEDIHIVMEYVEGEALGSLQRMARLRNQRMPLAVALAIAVDTLRGLHAAHEARDEKRQLLGIVHRDVSPQNVLVGVDGVARLLDFGVAKALHTRGQDTRPGVVKGKSSYMAPEQIRGEPVTRQADIFAASAVLWELVTSQRLFAGGSEHERMYQVLRWTGQTPPSAVAPGVPAAVDEVLLKGLAADPSHRFVTALEMAEAVQAVMPVASPRAVGEWVAATAAEPLHRRAEILKRVESAEVSFPVIVPLPPGGHRLSVPAVGHRLKAPSRPWDQLVLPTRSHRAARALVRRSGGAGVAPFLAAAVIALGAALALSSRGQPRQPRPVVAEALPPPTPAPTARRSWAAATNRPRFTFDLGSLALQPVSRPAVSLRPEHPARPAAPRPAVPPRRRAAVNSPPPNRVEPPPPSPFDFTQVRHRATDADAAAPVPRRVPLLGGRARTPLLD